MKEAIIIILILIVIIFGGTLEQKYLQKSGGELISRLDELNNFIKENRKDIEEIKNKSNDVYDKWKKIESKWSIIVLHNELDLIETALIEMKTNMETEDIEEGIVELEKSIFLVNHINEKEKLNVKNIF